MNRRPLPTWARVLRDLYHTGEFRCRRSVVPGRVVARDDPLHTRLDADPGEVDAAVRALSSVELVTVEGRWLVFTPRGFERAQELDHHARQPTRRETPLRRRASLTANRRVSVGILLLGLFSLLGVVLRGFGGSRLGFVALATLGTVTVVVVLYSAFSVLFRNGRESVRTAESGRSPWSQQDDRGHSGGEQ